MKYLQGAPQALLHFARSISPLREVRTNYELETVQEKRMWIEDNVGPISETDYSQKTDRLIRNAQGPMVTSISNGGSVEIEPVFNKQIGLIDPFVSSGSFEGNINALYDLLTDEHHPVIVRVSTKGKSVSKRYDREKYRLVKTLPSKPGQHPEPE